MSFSMTSFLQNELCFDLNSKHIFKHSSQDNVINSEVKIPFSFENKSNLDLNQDNNANDVKINTDEVKKDIECSLTSIDSVQSNLLTDISVNENKKNYVSDKQKLFEVETKQESNGKLKRELSTFSFEQVLNAPKK
jgi:hypothetical protein